MRDTEFRIHNSGNRNLCCFVFCFLFVVFCGLFLGAGGEHEELTFKTYFPIFSIQLAGFILLLYIIVRFALPPIENAIKERKHNIDNYIQSLEEKIVSYNKKLNELQEQFNDIQKIIEDRKKAREQEIEKIASSIEKEIEETKQKISERIKLEEELEVLRLKIFITDHIKSKVYDYVKKNLTNKQLQNIQKEYEQEFLSKFVGLKHNPDFISKLRTL